VIYVKPAPNSVIYACVSANSVSESRYSVVYDHFSSGSDATDREQDSAKKHGNFYLDIGAPMVSHFLGPRLFENRGVAGVQRRVS
jgi:hypothetical protein